MLTGKLKALWHGEIPLVKAFWLYYVGVIVLLYIFLRLFYNQWIITVALHVNLAILKIPPLLLLLFGFPYQIVALVGLWKSSNRYMGNKLWKILIKIYVVFVVINIPNGISTLLGMFNLF